MNKTYSIIIPHKNIVPLLKRCLESIPNRNDIQVIVVDDHSDVKNIQQIEQLCKNNNADLVKTQESKGAGYVRNIGLKYASGKWVLFADADDFFHSEAFLELDKFVISSYDVVYFYCDSKNSDSLKPDKDRVPAIKNGILNKDYDLLRYKSSVPWGKLISMNLIRKLVCLSLTVFFLRLLIILQITDLFLVPMQAITTRLTFLFCAVRKFSR